ncbi:hypothetical protein FRACYDRAFT_271964 [Fragilariopsis cylindrus CCMP1102]|uniref:peptidylprolyl isomerase n=1 Tax=Fragilariopsis cylindrus CCMP1102 TaxID=635003 RepID=A0A1E7ENT4_9STRA|nr:hypothetical protein FRACYDRAFT_271964 [Fragilariopsis cylindrus CCMP1102]|eukprot:OEU07618.1 hypothetical protein FRACYDRAFT_271964 [Fragilariopsis cylindrus CCMP1102]
MLLRKLITISLLLVVPFVAYSWQPQQQQQVLRRQRQRQQFDLFVNRRDVMEDIGTATVFGGFLVAFPLLSTFVDVEAAHANDGEFGTSTPLPSPSMAASTSGSGVFVGETTQFTTLPNGVKIKDFKIGTGSESVNSQSQNVALQMNGRLINTNAGITFYNTKNNNPDGFGPEPLVVNLSKGEVLPGLEAGLIGMKKNGIRRIVVPAGELSYEKYPSLEPKPMTAADQRALDSLVKNKSRDSTVMFDVKVERFK